MARNVPSSQKSDEHPGGRRASRRANIWRDSPNSEESVEWAGGRPAVRRDPGDRKGTDQLGVLHVRKCAIARRALNSQKGIK